MTQLAELKVEELKTQRFIVEKVKELAATVGKGIAINALSGGVDSSVVTMIGHAALGDKLKTYFIDNGIMREGEPEGVVSIFKKLGVKVEILDAQKEFFTAFKGLRDPEDKRHAVTDVFYKKVFGKLVKKSKAQFLLQGTIYTDVEETIAGIKRQHNILAQLGIDTKKQYGYTVLEPLINLRKPAVRLVGEALGLPEEIFNRPPFPGPALAARIIGEVTPERVSIVRQATTIVEEEIPVTDTGAFQCMAILHDDRVTGMRDGKRDYGLQIEVRSWNTADAVTASPTNIPFSKLEDLADRITSEVPGVVNVVYNITKKPPSTMEVV